MEESQLQKRQLNTGSDTVDREQADTLDHREKSTVSLIVEWENSHNTDDLRTRQMLGMLSQQIGARTHSDHLKYELIVAYDPLDTHPSHIQEKVRRYLGRLPGDLLIRVIPMPGSSYYVLKNRAALAAKGELIVFIDCDVLPQTDWLRNILEPFSDPKVAVSQGATYVEPHNLITTALALAWIFPLRLKDGSLSEKKNVFANNIAFRRSVFLEYPYPDLGTWRGQCIVQRKTLKSHGIAVNWSANARTIHPFPDGISGIVKRACLNGIDHVTRYEMAGGKVADWRASYRRFKTFRKRARKRRDQMSDELGLSGADKLACDLFATGYWGVALLSACMLHAFPDFWRGLFKDLPGNIGPATVSSVGTGRYFGKND